MSGQQEFDGLVQEARTAGIGTESSHCLRCRRALTNPRYRAIGYGRICLQKTLGEMKSGEARQAPGKGPVGCIVGWKDDFRFTRAGTSAGDEAVTNVPWRVADHSPTGMNFGYGGSGPADAALNLLSVLVGSEAAWPLHQDFKWAFIAPLDQKCGGVIKLKDVLAWLSARGVHVPYSEEAGVGACPAAMDAGTPGDEAVCAICRESGNTPERCTATHCHYYESEGASE